MEKLQRDPSTSILRLKRFAEAEIGIGLTVLLAAASLTSLPPAIGLVQDRVTWPEIVERFSPQWPRLTSPSSDQLTINQLQAQIAEAGCAANPRAPGLCAWRRHYIAPQCGRRGLVRIQPPLGWHFRHADRRSRVDSALQMGQMGSALAAALHGSGSLFVFPRR